MASGEGGCWGKKGAKHTHVPYQGNRWAGQTDPVEKCGEVARDEIQELEKMS